MPKKEEYVSCLSVVLQFFSKKIVIQIRDIIPYIGNPVRTIYRILVYFLKPFSEVRVKYLPFFSPDKLTELFHHVRATNERCFVNAWKLMEILHHVFYKGKCQVHCPLNIPGTVSYTHLRAHETDSYLVCRLLLEKKK